MVASILRIDSRPIKYEWEQLKNGTLRAFGVLGKVGTLLDYYQWDGKEFQKRTETITAEQLFRDDSLQSAWGMPITLGHTPEGLFDANKDRLLVGSCLQEFRKDEENGELALMLTIQDQKGIRLVKEEEEQGRSPELSPVYFLERVDHRGDGIFLQVGRKYDSLALLREGEGRGGNDVRLRVDSKDCSFPQGTAIAQKLFILNSQPQKKESNGVDLVIRVDGADKVFRDVDENLATEVKKVLARVDSLSSQNQTLTSEKSALEATVDSTKLQLKDTKAKLEEALSQRIDEAKVTAIASERGRTWDLIEPMMQEVAKKHNKTFRRDSSFTVTQIKTAYLQTVKPELKLDGKDQTYIDICFDALKPTEEENNRLLNSNKKEETITRTDSLFEELSIGGVGNETPNLDSQNAEARQAYITNIQNGGVTA